MHIVPDPFLASASLDWAERNQEYDRLAKLGIGRALFYNLYPEASSVILQPNLIRGKLSFYWSSECHSA